MKKNDSLGKWVSSFPSSSQPLGVLSGSVAEILQGAAQNSSGQDAGLGQVVGSGNKTRKELNIEQGLTIYDFRSSKTDKYRSEIANRCV